MCFSVFANSSTRPGQARTREAQRKWTHYSPVIALRSIWCNRYSCQSHLSCLGSKSIDFGFTHSKRLLEGGIIGVVYFRTYCSYCTCGDQNVDANRFYTCAVRRFIVAIDDSYFLINKSTCNLLLGICTALVLTIFCVFFFFSADEEYLRFQGNESINDYFKLVLRDATSNSLLVGAR